jgi:hypothetical protein
MLKYAIRTMRCIAAIALLAQPLGGCVAAQEEVGPAPDDEHALVQEGAGDPATPQDPFGQEVSGATGFLCCIDYSCPGTDIEFTGCKAGGSGPGAAYRACESACSVSCTSSGLYCD